MSFNKIAKLSISLCSILLLLAGLSACSGDNAKSPATENKDSAKTAPVKPKAVTLDINKLNELANGQLYADVVDYIHTQDPVSVEVIDWLKKKSEEGHVPLQLELSSQLADTDPAEALKWFSIGHLGLKIDSSVCSDSKAVRMSIGQVISGHKASSLFRKSPEALNEAVEYSLKWYEDHPVRPAPSWACGYGREISADEIKMIPEEKWQDARTEVYEKSKTLHERIKIKLNTQKQKGS